MAGNRSAKSFQCPSCASPQEIIAASHSQTYACPSCFAIIDLTKPEYAIIAKFQEVKNRPLIPLGMRGTLKGKKWQVIGYTLKTDGSGMYSWSEYLLFNPYHGFRWLVESNGHWSFGVPLKEVPGHSPGWNLTVQYNGASFKPFLVGKARVKFILGEFYWEARVGDSAAVADYISPPFTLSSEEVPDEINWSLLEYLPRKEIEAVFREVKKTPSPYGIAPNQPSPYQNVGRSMMIAVIAVGILLVGQGVIKARQLNATVLESGFTTTPAARAQNKVVPLIELPGKTSNVMIESYAPVNNSWIELEYVLTNLQSGEQFGTATEVSYFSGRDSDGSWTEGSQRRSAVIPAVPPGKYSLQISEAASPNLALTYTAKVKRDVPQYGNTFLACLLLLAGPVYRLLRRASFEATRWQDSDLSGGY